MKDSGQRKARFKTGLIYFFSLVIFLASAWGIRAALKSPLFLVRVVEVEDLPDGFPIDAQSITQLAAVPLGQVGLYDLPLKEIEARILSHPWVRSVNLSKRFPQTLTISAVLRVPRALFQSHDGQISYVDQDGKVFGSLRSNLYSDLPILSGLNRVKIHESDRQVSDALKIIDAWGLSNLSQISKIASLSFDFEHGYRAWVTYRVLSPHTQKTGSLGSEWVTGRTLVTLGSDVESEFSLQLGRLEKVFSHLSDRGILARQIFADAGKKIVVKIARGS